MYNHEVPLLAAHGKESPAGLADIMLFALMSIREPFQRMPAIMRDVKLQGAKSPFLWGWKIKGYEWLYKDPWPVHRLFDGLQHPAMSTCAAIYHIIDMPGLGIVKSAFVAQMLGHEVACMDTRNLQEMGQPPYRALPAEMKFVTKLRHIQNYVEDTIASGGAKHWWDLWCMGMGPSLGKTADEVSKLHTKLIIDGGHYGRL